MSTDGLPSGWTSRSGVLGPAESVEAYAARAQVVKGVCRAKGCFRKVELEPRTLCGQGLGRLPMDQVQRLYRCARLDGCGLDYHREPPLNPLRLEQFVGRPNVRVRLRCRGDRCRFFRVWRVEEMIAGLAGRGRGSGRTEIDELGAMMTSACPLCKRVNWTAEVLWVDTSTMGWRALGEGSFEKLT
jgi:hypothetical protein